MYTEVCSCIILSWGPEKPGSHLSTLCDDDGESGLVVGSSRNILLGRRSQNVNKICKVK